MSALTATDHTTRTIAPNVINDIGAASKPQNANASERGTARAGDSIDVFERLGAAGKGTAESNAVSARVQLRGPVEAIEAQVSLPGAQKPPTDADVAQPASGGDRVFTGKDVETLRGVWGTRAGEEGFDPAYDLDGDGRIGAADLAFVLGSIAAQAATAASAAPTSDGTGEADGTAEPTAPTLEAIRAAWGTSAGEEGFDAALDLDGDGKIGSADLAQHLGSFAAQEQAVATEPAKAPTVADIYKAFGAQEGEERFDAGLDLDGDGKIGSADLAQLLGRVNPQGSETASGPRPSFDAGDLKTLLSIWGARSGQERFDSGYDFDGDGVIGSADLAQLLGRLR